MERDKPPSDDYADYNGSVGNEYSRGKFGKLSGSSQE